MKHLIIWTLILIGGLQMAQETGAASNLIGYTELQTDLSGGRAAKS
jgi:hypothetical protein